MSALVLWGPRWRSDQKDISLREAAAQRGIEEFFSSSGCYTKVQILRTVGGRAAIDLSDSEIQHLTAATAARPSRAIVIVVRELGPVVKLLASAALVEGGTEVVLDIRARSLNQAATLAAFKAHWQHGGPGVIKGVATLEQDMRSALHEALQPRSARP